MSSDLSVRFRKMLTMNDAPAPDDGLAQVIDALLGDIDVEMTAEVLSNKYSAIF